MKDAARLQSSIELLAIVEDAWRTNGPSADRCVNAYFRARRYAGSKDRRDIAERVYDVIRTRGALAFRLGEDGEGAIPARSLIIAQLARQGRSRVDIEALFSGDAYAPPTLSQAESAALAQLIEKRSEPETGDPDWARWNIPPYLAPLLRTGLGERAEEEMMALAGRAPLDLRVNSLKATREEARVELAREGVETELSHFAPFGLRVKVGDRVTETAAFREGLIEIQDEGAQVAALLAAVQPGHQTVDLCAGAGGKTLAVAAAMENRGQIHAFDTDRLRLDELRRRVQRAGARNVQCVELTASRERRAKALVRLEGGADRVILDVPCSGSGTWRRNPEQRWRLTRERLAHLCGLQSALLEEGAALVRPGGRLIYITCSLLPPENEDRIADFLKRAPDFNSVPYRDAWREASSGAPPVTACRHDVNLLLLPGLHGTDGFFVSVLERSRSANR